LAGALRVSKALASRSVDQREIERFSRLAEEWWDPDGKFRPLHQFNPVRLCFIRDIAAEYFGRDPHELTPFGGLTLLDIGCGGGLLSEPMARMGFQVTGADASEKNVKIAQAHARDQDMPIEYCAATAEGLVAEGRRFDAILNMEVIEHVADIPAFVDACADLLKPGGIMFVATINRTLRSLMLAKIAAEYVLRWLPAGTHDWNRLITPDELRQHLQQAGLSVTRVQGMIFDPLRWDWRLSSDTAVNYAMVSSKS
jgi:2-polyprenyl-6-hydroxyphenyl methylase / 3-demethylubiquinone-9 3-methyltransferase